ncbi:MAG: metal-dependent hydrolase [Opitutaceae bacterium]|nr:metal-dependent hydrolase [Opitutaceae bacterium]
MKLTYYGHSCFLVETAQARLLIDPFFTGNPSAPVPASAVTCDYILLSHGHSDHTGDAAGIASECAATIIANHEIAEHYGAQGLKVHGMNPGGGHNFPFGRVNLTIAFHTSSFDQENPPRYAGCACGIVIEADGKRLYHAGDTALFSDMQLIGRRGLDLALLPIGDNYTMGPEDALLALDYLRPKLCVPMHYNTWPPIAQDAAAFAARAAQADHLVNPLAPGRSLEF